MLLKGSECNESILSSECADPWYCYNGKCDGQFDFGHPCDTVSTGSMCKHPYECNDISRKCDIKHGEKQENDACNDRDGTSECSGDLYCFRGRCKGNIMPKQSCDELTFGSMCVPPYKCYDGKCKLPDLYGCNDKSECRNGRVCKEFRSDGAKYYEGYSKVCYDRDRHMMLGGNSDSFNCKNNWRRDERRCDPNFFIQSVSNDGWYLLDDRGVNDDNWYYNNGSKDCKCPGRWSGVPNECVPYHPFQ